MTILSFKTAFLSYKGTEHIFPLGARKKFEADAQMQAERTEQIQSECPETLDAMVQSISDSFERFLPFSDATLLVAFKANPEEVQRIMTKSCKKVLSAPIRKDEYHWFRVRAHTPFCTCVCV